MARWASEGFIRHEEVQHYLELAALAAGMEAKEVGSHSLRIGGATAMYRGVDDPKKVQNFRENTEAYWRSGNSEKLNEF